MKILIVDDETHARERLIRLLSEIDDQCSIIEAKNGLDALNLFNTQSPDLILLDIRMPVMDGLEVAHHLAEIKAPPAIIFTTAYPDYALEAFNTQAIDYLMKPIRKERLEQSLNKAQALGRPYLATLLGNNPRSHLSATVHGNIKLVRVDQIYYLRADQKYVAAVWPGGEMLVDDSLKSLEQEFGASFTRIHRNTLVAPQYIRELDKDDEGKLCVTLRDLETKLLVSRRHASALRKLMKRL